MQLEAKSGSESHALTNFEERERIFLNPVVTDEESDNMLNLLCLNNPESLTNINRDPDNVEAGRQYSYSDLIQALQNPENR